MYRFGLATLRIRQQETLRPRKHELSFEAVWVPWLAQPTAVFDYELSHARLTPPPGMVFVSSELELDSVTKVLLEEIRKLRPARLVIDSVSELRMLNPPLQRGAPPPRRC